MNIKSIIWPWGRIKDLEEEIGLLDEEIEELEEDVDMLIDRSNILAEVVMRASRDFGIAAVTLADVNALIAGLKVPNGTTKKIGRLVEEAIGNLSAELTEDYLTVVREAMAREAELEADLEALTAESETEQTERAKSDEKLAERAKSLELSTTPREQFDTVLDPALTVAAVAPSFAQEPVPQPSAIYDFGDSCRVDSSSLSSSFDSGFSSSSDSGSFGGGCD